MIRIIDYLALTIGMAFITWAIASTIGLNTLALLDQVNHLL